MAIPAPSFPRSLIPSAATPILLRIKILLSAFSYKIMPILLFPEITFSEKVFDAGFVEIPIPTGFGKAFIPVMSVPI